MYLQLTINTDRLVDACNNGTIYRSENPDKPAIINQSYVFIAKPDYLRTNKIKSKYLKITAQIGDHILLYATSEYSNIDNPVLIYSIVHDKGHKVLDDFLSKKLILPGIEPDDETIIPPVIKKDMDYWHFRIRVASKGIETFNIRFALYQRDRKQETPILYGYFGLSSRIIVE
jgi:hypothetical protein